MKVYRYLILFSWISISGFAQEGSTQDWIKVLSYGVGNRTEEKQISAEEAFQRNDQCFPSEFAVANLTLSNNEQVENVVIKYDYKEKVLLVQRDDKVIIGAPNIVRKIQFQNPEIDDLVNVQELGRSYGRRGFYSVLSSQDGNYLLKYQTFEQKKQLQSSSVTTTEVYEVQDAAPEFINKEEFYITKEQQLFVLENFKSKTLSQFGQYANSLKTFIKNEKLKFKNEEDLKIFASYLWSI